MGALLAAVRRFGDRDLAEEFEGAEPCFELTLPIDVAQRLVAALDGGGNVVSIVGRQRA